jgi:MYND finger
MANNLSQIMTFQVLPPDLEEVSPECKKHATKIKEMRQQCKEELQTLMTVTRTTEKDTGNQVKIIDKTLMGMEIVDKYQNQLEALIGIDELAYAYDHSVHLATAEAAMIKQFGDSSCNQEFDRGNACANCRHKGPWKMCAGCKKVYYCTYECQRRDWADHKKYCPGKGKDLV